MEMHKPNTLKTQTEELHWAGLQVAVSLSCINREATSLWGTGETQSHVSLCVPSCDPSPGRQGHNGIIFSCLRTYKALLCFFLPLPFSLQMLQVSSEISFPYFLCSSSMGARHSESEPCRMRATSLRVQVAAGGSGSALRLGLGRDQNQLSAVPSTPLSIKSYLQFLASWSLFPQSSPWNRLCQCWTHIHTCNRLLSH